MNTHGIHPLDLAVVVGYFAMVIAIGWFTARRASRQSVSEEGFFLAGRKLGKLYQFFLSFGNATEPQGAVSTASLVYQRGVTGVWFAFQTIFMNPYFWFMNTWFRRVRLVTTAELFEDRLGSRGLSRVYTVFQVAVACALLGFGNFVAYKIVSTLLVKPDVEWTAVEKESVDAYHELRALEKAAGEASLAPERQERLGTLRDRQARGELRSFVTVVQPRFFYLIFSLAIGTYIILGGMAAAALNEALQGILIVVYSAILIPAGLNAIGGWHVLAERVPRDMFNLFAGEGGSPLFIFSVLLVGLVQLHGLSHNMVIYGSAKNEFAARFGGVSGAYMKRVMIVLWAFIGLVTIAIFGVGGLADPDAAWGVLSQQLLGPGFLGLMLAGVLADTMSTLAAKALAISSLFVRNILRQIWPDASQATGVLAARCTVAAVLVIGVISAEAMRDLESLIKLTLTINLPFGAAVILMFFWRRLTAPCGLGSNGVVGDRDARHAARRGRTAGFAAKSGFDGHHTEFSRARSPGVFQGGGADRARQSCERARGTRALQLCLLGALVCRVASGGTQPVAARNGAVPLRRILPVRRPVSRQPGHASARARARRSILRKDEDSGRGHA